MSETSNLTDERLRTWYLSQPDREEMCIGILRLDERFTDVRPRRPRGGPDGGRDIEAVEVATGRVVWGAVGFSYRTTDSATVKSWAFEKFKNDLEAAQRENPGLSGFLERVGLSRLARSTEARYRYS